MNFPSDFLWGSATSSYQIEGAALEDGRGECIWHRFSHTPGKIINGDVGDVACDHYHRFKDDVALMQQIGLQAYRFSISWPRVIPLGTGATNQPGLDFYDQLVDELLKANIKPFATLYHWDLPQALQDQEGWENRKIIDWFAEYTDVMTRLLGDRVQYWVTHNEPWVVAFLGNSTGEHAPGYKDIRKALKVAHHLNLAHGAAVPIIRQNVSNAKVGIVNAEVARTPSSHSPIDSEAVEIENSFSSRWFLDPVFKGSYPQNAVATYGNALDEIDLDEAKLACQPLDFLGVNYYFRTVVASAEEGKAFPTKIIPQDAPKTTMDWEIYPVGLTEVLLRVNNEYAPAEIYITENGAAFDDPAPANGVVEDPDRQEYLERHFEAAGKAMEAGVPVKGYFVWSFLDNFEWSFGYRQTFGIVHVNFDTLERIPKRSALFYKDWIAQRQPV